MQAFSNPNAFDLHIDKKDTNFRPFPRVCAMIEQEIQTNVYFARANKMRLLLRSRSIAVLQIIVTSSSRFYL